jgi:hypothetical protein
VAPRRRRWTHVASRDDAEFACCDGVDGWLNVPIRRAPNVIHKLSVSPHSNNLWSS